MDCNWISSNHRVPQLGAGLIAAAASTAAAAVAAAVAVACCLLPLANGFKPNATWVVQMPCLCLRLWHVREKLQLRLRPRPRLPLRSLWSPMFAAVCCCCCSCCFFCYRAKGSLWRWPDKAARKSLLHIAWWAAAAALNRPRGKLNFPPSSSSL